MTAKEHIHLIKNHDSYHTIKALSEILERLEDLEKLAHEHYDKKEKGK